MDPSRENIILETLDAEACCGNSSFVGERHPFQLFSHIGQAFFHDFSYAFSSVIKKTLSDTLIGRGIQTEADS